MVSPPAKADIAKNRTSARAALVSNAQPPRVRVVMCCVPFSCMPRFDRGVRAPLGGRKHSVGGGGAREEVKGGLFAAVGRWIRTRSLAPAAGQRSCAF